MNDPTSSVSSVTVSFLFATRKERRNEAPKRGKQQKERKKQERFLIFRVLRHPFDVLNLYSSCSQAAPFIG